MKYLMLKHYRGAPVPTGFVPMDQWPPHAEAVIAALHADAPSAEETDWVQVVEWRDGDRESAARLYAEAALGPPASPSATTSPGRPPGSTRSVNAEPDPVRWAQCTTVGGAASSSSRCVCSCRRGSMSAGTTVSSTRHQATQ